MKKFTIKNAQYGISVLSISKDTIAVETSRAELLKNIINACLIASCSDGIVLGFNAEVIEHTLQLSGNVMNALMLFKNKQLISGEQIDKILLAMKQNEDAPKLSGGKPNTKPGTPGLV